MQQHILLGRRFTRQRHLSNITIVASKYGNTNKCKARQQYELPRDAAAGYALRGRSHFIHVNLLFFHVLQQVLQSFSLDLLFIESAHMLYVTRDLRHLLGRSRPLLEDVRVQVVLGRRLANDRRIPALLLLEVTHGIYCRRFKLLLAAGIV